ncbi:MAG: Fic family protein [Bacteroidales bacterium]|nr:Fic family protein [Bacteroidales bacterium]
MKILTKISQLQKKVETLRPLSEEQNEELKKYYKIGLTYSSNALEGNSLTESETRIAIEDGLTVAGKPLKDYYEAIGHARSFDLLFQLAKKEAFTEEDIKQLHKLFFQGIDAEKAGLYRNIRVFISGSKYSLPRPEEVPSKMKQFVLELGINPGLHPVIWASELHKRFVFIHPFIDGNGRVARLLMNFALLQNSYPITIIPPIRRIDYINALEKAHTDDKIFIEFIAEAVQQAQLEYLRLLK